MDCEKYWTHYKMDFGQDSTFYLAPVNSHSNKGVVMILWISTFQMSTQTLCQVFLKMLGSSSSASV